MLGQDRQVTSRGWTVGVALLLLVTAGCGGTPEAKPSPTPSAPPTTAAPVAAKPDPKVGACRNLDFAAATQSVDDTPAIPCKKEHTSVTFAVGQLDLIQDGHLVAMDSKHVQQQLDDKCGAELSRWVGGDKQALRLSQFRPVWFRPDVKEADRGASWYRCDVVTIAANNQLASFKGNLKGVLGDDSGLDRFGRCGTSSPANKNFRQVICSRDHSWRAVSTIDIPQGADYLGKKASAAADTVCQDRATSEVKESLKYEWAFQWPSRQDFDAGQRYGWCWLPR